MRNLRGLLKFAQIVGMDPTDNFMSYDQTPASPVVNMSQQTMLPPDKAEEAVKNVNKNVFNWGLGTLVGLPSFLTGSASSVFSWPLMLSSTLGNGLPAGITLGEAIKNSSLRRQNESDYNLAQEELKKREGLQTAEIPDDIKYYYDVLVPAIKALGNPNDGAPKHYYNKLNYRPGFYNEIPLYEDPDRKIIRENSGGHSRGRSPWSYPYITVLDKNDESSIGHELKHQQFLDSYYVSGPSKTYVEGSNQPIPSGRSIADDEHLSRVWNFTPEDVDGNVKAEQGTTHAEHQIAIMKDFKNKFGHLPSPEEFWNFTRNADYETKATWRDRIFNGYQQSADRRNLPDTTKFVDERKKKWKDLKINAPFKVTASDAKSDKIRRFMKGQPWYRLDPRLYDMLFQELIDGKIREFYPDVEYWHGTRKRERYTKEQLDDYIDAINTRAKNESQPNIQNTRRVNA